MFTGGVERACHSCGAVDEIDRLSLCSFFLRRRIWRVVICWQGFYRPATRRRPVITACWTMLPRCTGSPTTSGRSAAIRHRLRWWATASGRPPSTCWLCHRPLEVSTGPVVGPGPAGPVDDGPGVARTVGPPACLLWSNSEVARWRLWLMTCWWRDTADDEDEGAGRGRLLSPIDTVDSWTTD